MRTALSVTLVGLLAAGACTRDAAPSGGDASDAKDDGGNAKDEPAEGEEVKAADDAERKPVGFGKATKSDADDDEGDKDKAEGDGRGLAGAVERAVEDATSIKGLELIPDRAILLAGVDVAGLVNLPVWPELKASLGTRQLSQMQAAAECGLGEDKWRTFVIGTEPATRGMAMVVTVEGVGKHENLRCLAGVLGFTLEPDGKRMSDHTGGGIVLDDDSIAFASTKWMDALEDRIAGRGKAAAAGPLRAALARTDRSKTLWLAGTLPEIENNTAETILGSRVENLAGWADLRDGLEVRLSVAVPDGKDALSRLQIQWFGAKPMLESRGVPKGITGSVELSEKDNVVSLRVSATPEETRTLTDGVRDMMGI